MEVLSLPPSPILKLAATKMYILIEVLHLISNIHITVNVAPPSQKPRSHLLVNTEHAHIVTKLLQYYTTGNELRKNDPSNQRLVHVTDLDQSPQFQNVAQHSVASRRLSQRTDLYWFLSFCFGTAWTTSPTQRPPPPLPRLQLSISAERVGFGQQAIVVYITRSLYHRRSSRTWHRIEVQVSPRLFRYFGFPGKNSR